jgi:hypothetical protein
VRLRAVLEQILVTKRDARAEPEVRDARVVEDRFDEAISPTSHNRSSPVEHFDCEAISSRPRAHNFLASS